MSLNLSRRKFMTLLAAGSLLGQPVFAAAPKPRGRRVGVALGGGGARGLAHLVILEALDEMGVRPHCLSGTSMGAVMGALYAAGHSAAAIKAIIDAALASKRRHGGFFRKELLEWVQLMDPAMGRAILLSSGDFIGFIHDEIGAKTFAQLQIPLQVVAADIRRRQQVVLAAGDLLTALRASIAFPGLFDPVMVHDRLLVDGGMVNPVPYDLLLGECDIVIAVDVAGRRTQSAAEPGFFEIILDSFQTMEHTIVAEKIKNHAPAIYVKPDLVDIRLLDFAKAPEIYRQAQPAKQQLKHSLQKLLA
jgi:NTE family protein